MADIKIRPHQEKDIPLRVKWLNNALVSRYIGDEPGSKTDIRKEREWFRNYRRCGPGKRFFTICDGKKPIGFMGLSKISRENRNADLFIAIGEDEYRGRGLGREALVWLLKYAFRKLKLHKVNLGVIEDNIHAIDVYKSLGFKVEGVMKDEVRIRGRYRDMISMAIFKKH